MGRSYFKAQTEGWLFLPFSQTDSANDLYCSNHFLDQILKKRKEKRAGRVLKPARGRHGSNMKRSYLYPSVLQRCALFLLFRCAFALITRQRDEVQHEDFRSNSAENTRVVQAVQSPRGSQEQVVILLNHFRHTQRLSQKCNTAETAHWSSSSSFLMFLP